MSIEKNIEEEKTKKKVKQKPFTQSEERLRELMLNTINVYRTLIFPEAYEIIKAKLLFTGDIKAAYKSIWEDMKTAAVYPLIWPIHDSFSANLYDSVVTPKVSAREEADKTQSEMAQDFCDWAQDVSDWESAKKLIRNEASLIGTSYGMAWWDKREETIKFMKQGIERKSTRSISQPTCEFVSFFELFYDRSTVKFSRARWKARRKILSLNEVIRRYWSLIDFNDKNKLQIQDSVNDVICNYDFTKIYEIKNYEDIYCGDWLTYSDPLTFLEENVLTSITDKNPLLEVIEYWEWDQLTIMINGRIYYDDASPYPAWDPFSIVVYEEIPWTCRGLGIGQKIMPHQRQASFYFSKIKDAIGQHIDPMYTVIKGSVIWANGKTPETISWMPWKVLQIEDPTIPNAGIKAIQFIDYNVINLAVQQLNDAIMRAQETVGTNSYVQGWAGKVERSFGAANLKVAVTATRLKPINSSLSKFDQHMFEQWLALASQYLDDEFAVKVLGPSGYEYKTIKPFDLMNKFDITVDIDAIRDLTKSERSQTVLNMLNAIAPYNINPISNTPAISPETVIWLISDQMDFDWFNVMSKEEREAYVSEHLEISKRVQEASAPQTPNTPVVQNNWVMQVPQPDMPFESVQPLL